MTGGSIVFAVAVFVCLLGQVLCDDDPTESEINSVAKACNQFSLDLNTKLLKPGENVFFSPYSICTAFAMVLLGARGSTETELRNTFHYEDGQNINPVYKKVISDFNNQENSNFTLSTANRIYGNLGFTLNQTYQDNVEKYYLAELQQLDFSTGTAEGIINKWVEDQTHDKIKDLFPSGSLGPDTMLVLANAIYFKGTWLKEFNKDRTMKETFKVSQGSNQEVDMMNLEGNFPYYHDDELKVKLLELPYVGDRLAMVVVLPDEDFGLEEVAKKLDAAKLKELRSSTRSRKVKIKLPKFKMETEYLLNDALKDLNATEVFSNGANLSGISETPLKISQVRHKAFVEVNEEGTEAAAATGIVAVPMSTIYRPPEIMTFYADHPFGFAIIDKSSRYILFSGLVWNPANSK